MPYAARFMAKVYDKTGATFVRTIPWDLFLSVPAVVREVGKPASDLQLELAIPWDQAGYGVAGGLSAFNLVKLYAFTNDNPGGYLVYQGHVTEVVGVYADQADHVEVRLFPIDAILAYDVLNSSSYAATPIETVFSALIDDLNTKYYSLLSKNLAATGQNANYSETYKTHQALFEKLAGFLGATWYWRIRPNGQVDVQQYADSDADHELAVGRDVKSVRVTKSLLNVKNTVTLVWGTPPNVSGYADATSVAAYGKRTEYATDSSISSPDGADGRGNGDVAKLKDPRTKTQVVVTPSYPIETILPGDTVSVRNVADSAGQMLAGVLRVVRVRYDGATAVLDLDDVVDNFGVELAKVVG